MSDTHTLKLEFSPHDDTLVMETPSQMCLGIRGTL